MIHNFFVVLTAIIAVSFLLSGLDDLFIDLFYWLRTLYRALFMREAIRPIRQRDLCAPPEQWVAIWIPAWHEEEVIEQMLLHTIEAITYQNYDIFVGTYPNDPETQTAVDAISRQYAHVRKIVCPNPGPTNKADCLNWVYQGMVLAEQERGIRYAMIVMHDSEDIIHPLELKLFNWLIPRKDMVQIPVIPLEQPLSYWTAGTYLDEFAENHSKDLLVRERLAGVLPSAGVGTAVKRQVLEELAARHKNQLFNINSLTEDYEFGLTLASMKRTAILAQFSVARTQHVTQGWWRRRDVVREVRERIAVREYFPDRFRLAVRQKSRWVLGISFQGWKNLGWRGGFWRKYMLYRDRKALYTNIVNVFGYLVVFYWLADVATYGWAGSHPLVVSRWVWRVTVADTALMLHRMIQRVVAVWRIAGPGQALFSIPRTLVANAINFCATVVAAKQFFSAERTGKRVAWQKTAHVFPSAKQLQEHRRRLGDLLLENRLVTVTQLRKGLEAQQKHGRKLRESLAELGYLSEEDLLRILGRQLNIPFGRIDHRLIDAAWLEKVPRPTAEKLAALPIHAFAGTVLVACADPSQPGLKATLEKLLGAPVSLQLATPSDLRSAMDRAYLSKGDEPSRLLGEILVQAGAISPADLDRALQIQQRGNRRLGEILQDMGLISFEQLSAALKDQRASRKSQEVTQC